MHLTAAVLFSAAMNNRKTKIALWFRYGPGDHSELFHAMPHIVSALAEKSEVHYFGMKTKTAIPDIIRQHAILHHLPFRVDRTNQKDKWIKTLLWMACLPLLGLYCRMKKIDAVYIDETIPLSAALTRFFFGKKTAITVADFFADIYCTGAASILGRLIKYIDYASWRKLPLIFTRAKSTRNFLHEKGVPREIVHPVYDPCDLNLYCPLPDRDNIRSDFGYGPQDIVLVHHGILHPNKGNDLIIKALSEIREQIPHIKYLLIGDGPEKARLDQMVTDLQMDDVCRLTGWLPTLQDVNRGLNAGDIGLVMRVGNRSDDFHMTGALVHSMACGLPVLAARLAGVAEVVQENHNGYLFDPHNMDEFKRALIKLTQSADLRQKLGRQARQDAEQLFDMQAVTRRTAEPLLKLAGVHHE